MKLFLVPLLMILLLTQTFSKWMVVMEYKLNRGFIAKNLCVNKARPKMHCNGKCQMMKRLAVEEKQNSSNTTNSPIKITLQDTVFVDEIDWPIFHSLPFASLIYNVHQPILKYNSPVSSIFHPPANC